MSYFSSSGSKLSVDDESLKPDDFPELARTRSKCFGSLGLREKDGKQRGDGGGGGAMDDGEMVVVAGRGGH